MAESTELRQETLPQTEGQVAGGVLRGAWEKTKLAIARSVFWSYERGTWQYDVIVLAILAFIFLTPRPLFNDRPRLQLSDLRHVPGVVEVAHGKGWRSYQIDARLVESMGNVKLEEAVREILQQRLKKPVMLKLPIETNRDKNNVVLGYTVVVAQ